MNVAAILCPLADDLLWNTASGEKNIAIEILVSEFVKGRVSGEMSNQGEAQEPCPTTSGSVERGVVTPRSRSCRGCLSYSSFLRDNSQNPTCYGYSRSIPDSYRTLEERGATKDFKYACLGYGIHKEATGSSSPSNAKRPDGYGELPLCVGIEFLADRRPVSNKEEADTHMHNPLARPNAGPSEDFTARFCRSASLVATAVLNNVIRVAETAKTTMDRIFSSNDSQKSK